MPIATYDVLSAAAADAAVSRARPIVIDVRSPMRSTIAPQAMRVSIVPTSGAEAMRPGLDERQALRRGAGRG